MEKRTLEQIIEREQERRHEDGQFGIKACKESIEWKKEHCNESYYQQLENFVERANTDILFNKAMVLACWELINER